MGAEALNSSSRRRLAPGYDAGFLDPMMDSMGNFSSAETLQATKLSSDSPILSFLPSPRLGNSDAVLKAFEKNQKYAQAASVRVERMRTWQKLHGGGDEVFAGLRGFGSDVPAHNEDCSAAKICPVVDRTNMFMPTALYQSAS